MSKASELYRKHRPQDFDDVVGQDEAVASLRAMIDADKLPHAVLFVGPSGCGKTTLGRIVKDYVGCGDADFQEMNAADFRGIDSIRDIRQRMTLSPIAGEARVWLIDEVHQLTSQSQNALLKMLEDPPDHVYFFLATTHPEKLLKTIRTRCTTVAVKPLSDDGLREVMQACVEAEEIDVSQDVLDAIVDKSDGSARQALVLLHQVAGMDDEDEQLELIRRSSSAEEAEFLGRLLCDPRKTWQDVRKALREYEGDAEDLRWGVLGYARAVLLNGNGQTAERAYAVIAAFRDNFYDSKAAGLAAACWEVLHG